jgi:hypothetical protein
METWILGWQDLGAVTLVMVGSGLLLWLRRRVGQPACSACTRTEPAAVARPVPMRDLRIGRPRA